MNMDDFEFEEVPHIMVVESRNHPEVSDLLFEGTITVLDSINATYERFAVPSALEIPQAIKYAVRGLDFYTARKRFDAYIALGCVVQGETDYHDIVGRESAGALMKLALDHTLSIGNGILACDTREQALERAKPSGKNRGGEAARAALEMLRMKSHFGIFPRT
jgi:6,7-dimethyl-8-ribityllumazine synthase